MVILKDKRPPKQDFYNTSRLTGLGKIIDYDLKKREVKKQLNTLQEYDKIIRSDFKISFRAFYKPLVFVATGS